MSNLNLVEQPIFVEYTQFQDAYSYITENTAVERRPVQPAEVWFSYAQVPATPPVQSPFPGTSDGGNIVSGISDVVLTAVPGNPIRFQSLLGQFMNMVPAVAQNGAYIPTLIDSNGVDVKYDPSVWIADGLLRIVEFKYGVPPGLVAPFTLSYWAYIAPTLTGTGTVANEGGGTGQVFDSVISGVSKLRTLNADPAGGAGGLTVTTSGQQILIGNTLTGDNLPVIGGSAVFSSKVGNLLEFRQLLAGTGITISQSANAITFSTGIAPMPASFMNEGGGAGQIFDTVVGTVVMFRTIDLDPTVGNEGIVVATTGGGLVTVGNTLTGANVGAGSQLFKAKTAGALLQFRSLIAAVSSGLTFTQNANDITISAASGAVVNTLANEGAGTGSIFDSTVSNVANLRTLIADATTANLGIAITTDATTVTISNTLTGANVGAGAQLFAAKVGGALLNFRSLIAAGSSGLTFTQNTSDITVSATAGAVVTALANEGAGVGQIFDTIAGNTANLRTLVVDPSVGDEGIEIITNATTVSIGNTLTGTNIGTGVSLFAAKTAGALLQFRSLIAAGSSGLTFTQNASDITVSATAGAVVTALANEGAGVGQIFDSIAGNTANLRTLVVDPSVGDEGIEIITNATTVSIGNTLTGTNVGTGVSLFAAKTAGALLQFRTLIAAASSGLTLTQNANDITVSAASGAVVNTITNEGTGTGLVFDATASNIASLRSLAADPTLGNTGIVVTTSGATINIGNTMTGTNLGIGTGVFSSKTGGGDLAFNSLQPAASSGLALAASGGTITISAAAGAVVTASANTGIGTGLIFDSIVGNTANLRTLLFDTNSGNEGIAIATVGSNIVFGNTITGSNVGTGARVFVSKNALATLQFRTFIATTDSGLTLTQNANDITISASAGAVVTALANEGTGTGSIFDAIVGNTANLRTLIADATTANLGIAIATGATTVTISNTLTGANVGAGAAIFAAKVGGALLNFRSLIAAGSSGLTLTQNANDITVSATAGAVVTALANEGAGTGSIFDAIVGNTANLRTLISDTTTANLGIAIVTGATTVTVSNTLTGANIGAGAQLFSAKIAGALLNFRSLIAAASTGLTLTQNTNDITVSATAGAVVTALANEGAGTGSIFDSIVGNTANLRTLIADASIANSGIAIATGLTTVTVSNTLTAANLGTGVNLFTSKTAGAVLQFRSLIAAGSSGLTLTQNANDITLSATAGAVVTALANEGAGTGSIFDSIVGNTANLRTLVADTVTANSGIAIATGLTTVTISNTLTAANLGTGVNLFTSKTAGAVLQFRSLIAAGSSGLTFTQNANDITVSATAGAVVTALANEGTGTGSIFDSIVGNTANLRTLVADTTTANSGITIATGATTVTISNTLTATNLGAGAQIFISKTAGALLQLRSITQSTGITVTQNTNDNSIAIANTAVTAGTYRLTNLTVNAQGQLTAAATGGFGNVLFVDAVNGNNGLGAVNGYPFLTITAALAAATSGSAVYIFPGTYNESITIPTGVTVRGLSSKAVIIQQLAVIGSTDLVTMGTSTRLEDVTLMLTTASNVQIRGLVFPSTTTASSKLRAIAISVTNSSGAGSANTYGVHSTGTGVPAANFDALDRVTITVTGSGTNVTRGIILDTAASLNARFVALLVTGGATAYGCETNNAGASLFVRSSSISGTTADISQTSGKITLSTTDLANSNANSLGFATTITNDSQIFAVVGAIGANGNRFLSPGTASEVKTEVIQVRVEAPRVARALTISAGTAPGVGVTDTWTLRKNGASTGLSVSLTGIAMSATANTASATFAAGNTYDILQVSSNASATANIAVTVYFY